MLDAQLSLDFAVLPPPVERRLDAALGRIDAVIATLSEEHQQKIAENRHFKLIILLSRVRAMEMAEEDAEKHFQKGLADQYDSIVPDDIMPDGDLHLIPLLVRFAAQTFFPPPTDGGANG